MKVEKLILKDHPELLSYIENFAPGRVVLSDYFYSTAISFVNNQEIYSEKQIARILQLTDKEYAELISRYLSEGEEKEDDEKAQMQKRLNEITEKIQRSKEIESAKAKIEELEKELTKLNKDLGIVDSFQEKLTSAQEEFNKYQNLSRFNLQRVYDDLVKINSDIAKFEEQLLEQKVVDIRHSRAYYDYDRGKIGLAIGVGIASAIVGGIFLSISTPQWIVFTIWGIGLTIASIIIFTSRYQIISDESLPEDYYDYSDIQDVLDKLRAQRTGILRLLGMKTAEDFFLAKARFSSAKKNLDNLNQQKESFFTNSDPDGMKKRESLELELNQLREKTSNPSELLTSEEYLKLYQESDSLKLKLGITNPAQAIPKGEIPKRLAEIRKELSDKLPQYISILKSTFQNAIENVSNYIKKISLITGNEEIQLDKDLSNWDSLSLFNKTLIQFAVAKEIYKKDFAFAIENSLDWSEQEKEKLQKLTDSNDPELLAQIYLLDNEN